VQISILEAKAVVFSENEFYKTEQKIEK